MNELLKSTIPTIFSYFIFTIVCGVIKAELLLLNIDESIAYIARISSYTTLIISGLTAVLYFIGVMAAAYFIFGILGSSPENDVYTKAVTWFVLFYAIIEFSKLIIFSYLFLDNALLIVDSSKSIEKWVEDNNWYKISYIMDLIAFISALSSYVFILLRKSKKIELIDVSIVVLFFLAIFVLFHQDFFDFVK
jgi:hypothetical protein